MKTKTFKAEIYVARIERKDIIKVMAKFLKYDFLFNEDGLDVDIMTDIYDRKWKIEYNLRMKNEEITKEKLNGIIDKDTCIASVSTPIFDNDVSDSLKNLLKYFMDEGAIVVKVKSFI